MKPIKNIREKKTIDDEKTHYKILCEMGILDDQEDWPLYQKQTTMFMKEFEEAGEEALRKYIK